MSTAACSPHSTTSPVGMAGDGAPSVLALLLLLLPLLLPLLLEKFELLELLLL